ncbi:MAG: taurine dioxygenase [Acidimicrobiaceae bacterium]|nr:taurine dioxygenase [Acidimicrobiaceae bacterium]
MSELDIRPVAGMGAEVHGLDLDAIDEGVASQLTKALGDHLMLALPGLDPSLRGLRDIASLFGTVDPVPYLDSVDPDIPEVISLDSMYQVKADLWHTDATFLEQPPAIALLHMVDCPSHGGDTMFIDGHAVYDSLSPAMQGFLAGLTCIHDDARGDKSAEHPVVRTHPDTGRPALFVNKQFSRRIPQLSRPESQMLLSYLFRWQEQVQFSARWRWSPGDVVMWDERVTLHIMVNDTEGRRELRRVSVLGDRPAAHAPGAIGEPFGLPKTASSGFYGIGSYEF